MSLIKPICDFLLMLNSNLGSFSHRLTAIASNGFQGHDFHFVWHGVGLCYFILVIISNLGPISHRFRDTATYSLKHFIENCGQTAANGDMVTIDRLYRELSAPYPMVRPLTLYDLSFSHNTARLAYHSALWPFKVIQSQWFSWNLKKRMPLSVSD